MRPQSYSSGLIAAFHGVTITPQVTYWIHIETWLSLLGIFRGAGVGIPCVTLPYSARLPKKSNYFMACNYGPYSAGGGELIPPGICPSLRRPGKTRRPPGLYRHPRGRRRQPERPRRTVFCGAVDTGRSRAPRPRRENPLHTVPKAHGRESARQGFPRTAPGPSWRWSGIAFRAISHRPKSGFPQRVSLRSLSSITFSFPRRRRSLARVVLKENRAASPSASGHNKSSMASWRTSRPPRAISALRRARGRLGPCAKR